MVGAEGRAGHLPLELGGPATRIPRKTAVDVGASTLQGLTRHGKKSCCMTAGWKLHFGVHKCLGHGFCKSPKATRGSVTFQFAVAFALPHPPLRVWQ